MGKNWAKFYAESVSPHSLGSAVRGSECATPGNAVQRLRRRFPFGDCQSGVALDGYAVSLTPGFGIQRLQRKHRSASRLLLPKILHGVALLGSRCSRTLRR